MSLRNIRYRNSEKSISKKIQKRFNTRSLLPALSTVMLLWCISIPSIIANASEPKEEAEAMPSMISENEEPPVAAQAATEAIKITQQPQNITGILGGYADFNIEAEGDLLTYSWRFSYDDQISDSSYHIVAKNKTGTCKYLIQPKTSTAIFWCNIKDKDGNEVNSAPFYVSYNVEDGCIANGICGDNITWAIYNNGVMVIEGSGDMSTNIVWKDYAGKVSNVIVRERITSISEAAFYSMDIQGVSLPQSLKRIEQEAFSHNKLCEINLPDRLETIESSAFYFSTGKDGLEIILPRSLRTIGNGAFERCSASVISIPPSVTEIGSLGRFATDLVECEQDSAAHRFCQENGIPYNVVNYAGNDGQLSSGSCGDNARWEFDSSKDTLVISGSGAIESYPGDLYAPWHSLRSGITKVVIGEGITDIGSYAFYDMPFLHEVTLPRSMDTIGDGAFRRSESIEQVTAGCHAPDMGSNVFDTPQSISLSYPQNAVGYGAGIWIDMKRQTISNVIAADEFSLLDTNVAMKIGEKKNLEVSVLPNSFAKAIQWESSAPAIVTVNRGTVSAVSEGSAVVTARLLAGDEDLAYQCDVTVSGEDNEDKGDKEDNKEDTEDKGDKEDNKEDTDDKGDKEDNNNGNDTANTGGNVNATVKVSNITLSGISKKIAAGKKVKLAVEILPSNAANRAVTWTSSNTKVATVDSFGTVTMKKNSGGKSVTITATAADGSGVKAAYKIISMKGVVKKVAISGGKSVKSGKTLKLKAKVTASKKANKKLKWTSSNTKYAAVNSSGKVTAKKDGKGKSIKITAMATDGSGKKKTVTIKIK